MWYTDAWNKTAAKEARVSREIGAAFPHASHDGKYDNSYPAWWTNGFYPGLLWLIYRDTGDEYLKNTANEVEEKLDSVLKEYYNTDHDMGFLWSLSSVAQYKINGNEESRRRALHAANLLAGRFNLAGRFIRAWNGDKLGWAIIDCLMNLPLLYWASEETGDPRFRHIAVAHAQTALKYFLREDGSANHICSFDPESGEFIESLGGQGYGVGSAWSRGLSWAVYGFALSYKYTGKEEFLEGAQRAAKFFWDNLPDDKVPYWDFRLPETEGEPRDSSAAACAACGMLELYSLTGDECYLAKGEAITKSLYENYTDYDGDCQELIKEGTSNKPEHTNINVGLIYGDYFYAEALARLNGKCGELFW